MAPRTMERTTCLGCGCTCDDVGVQIEGGRIVGITPDCPVARLWFGDGSVPDRILVEGRPAALDHALANAAEILAGSAGRALVYIGPDLSTQAQRISVALGDCLGAVVDAATSQSAASGLLAAQRRGRQTATLGEIRNRADVLVFWAVDPSPRYPRYLSRYALEPVGTHVTAGRRGRTMISVSVGTDRGPPNADRELALLPGDEEMALSVLRAAVLQRPIPTLPSRFKQLSEVAEALLKARYAVLVHDAEPGVGPAAPHRSEGLLGLVEALNGVTRAALSSLRQGGNRSGAESVLTWQTGFPMAVDFASGHPRYEPSRRGIERLVGGGLSASLIAGSASELSPEAKAAISRVPTVAIGPRSSVNCPEARVIVDTGIAGIHEAGTAYRMDEVPLPLTPPLPGPRMAHTVLAELLTAVRARLDRRGR